MQDFQGLPHVIPKMRCLIVGGRIRNRQEDLHALRQVGPRELPNISRSGLGRHAIANKDRSRVYQ